VISAIYLGAPNSLKSIPPAAVDMTMRSDWYRGTARETAEPPSVILRI